MHIGGAKELLFSTAAGTQHDPKKLPTSTHRHQHYWITILKITTVSNTAGILIALLYYTRKTPAHDKEDLPRPASALPLLMEPTPIGAPGTVPVSTTRNIFQTGHFSNIPPSPSLKILLLVHRIVTALIRVFLSTHKHVPCPGQNHRREIDTVAQLVPRVVLDLRQRRRLAGQFVTDPLHRGRQIATGVEIHPRLIREIREEGKHERRVKHGQLPDLAPNAVPAGAKNKQKKQCATNRVEKCRAGDLGFQFY